LKEKKASERVFEYIEKMILQKNWVIGDKIDSEIQLSKNLGVSRISVREAIGSLATLNILERKKGGGTFVKQLTPNDYMDQLMPLLIIGNISYLEVMETRLALDVEAVSLFVEKATNKEVEGLDDIFKCMKENEGIPEEFYKKDVEFHQYIAMFCQNKILNKITNMLFKITTNYAREQYHSLTYKERIEEHNLIINAIKEKDLELSRLYTKRHVGRTIRDLKKKMSEK